ncbi:hypothetical protein V6N13_132977 [Hibiscus sabdariffa]|uniref:Uncharacterized protein n=1 Tax=Hibiscus sabdariffa TaxID=183260 RepID=A0ABR2PXB7_9ROSI
MPLPFEQQTPRLSLKVNVELHPICGFSHQSQWSEGPRPPSMHQASRPSHGPHAAAASHPLVPECEPPHDYRAE